MKLATKIICFTGGLLLVAVMRGGLAPVDTAAPVLPAPRLLVERLNQPADSQRDLPLAQTNGNVLPLAASLALSKVENERGLLLNHLQLTK